MSKDSQPRRARCRLNIQLQNLQGYVSAFYPFFLFEGHQWADCQCFEVLYGVEGIKPFPSTNMYLGCWCLSRIKTGSAERVYFYHPGIPRSMASYFEVFSVTFW